MKSLRTWLLLAASVALLATPLMADEPVVREAPGVAAQARDWYGQVRSSIEAVQDKQVETFADVTIVANWRGDTKLADLPAAFKDVATVLAAANKDSTFKVDGNSLKIGIPKEGFLEGAQLARVEFRSDCPTNSQFQVQSILTVYEQPIRDACIAWTRQRHNKSTAPLQDVVISAWNGTRNFDVRLNPEKVGFDPKLSMRK